MSYGEQFREEYRTAQDIKRQEECEDEIFHVQCSMCENVIDPHENPIYCWEFRILQLFQQIFMCEECDAEHRTIYNQKELIEKWRSDHDAKV